MAPKPALFNLKNKHHCILLKVTDERDAGVFLNKFLYYPISAITGLDYPDVSDY